MFLDLTITQQTLNVCIIICSSGTKLPISITVLVSMRGKIENLRSPSHQVSIEKIEDADTMKRRWSKACVYYKTGFMDRDFVLLITPQHGQLHYAHYEVSL